MNFPSLWQMWSEEVPNGAEKMQPACDIEESPSHFLLSFDLPGMKKEDIKIDYSEGALRISGERKDERETRKGGRYRTERFYGTFERAFTIPQDVKAEQIEAQFENGVLHVAVPKASAAQPRQIPVSEAKGGIFSRLLGKKEEKPNQKGNAA